MILGIMSDSHGDLAAVKRAADFAGEADLWLHAGDLCPDAEFLARYSGKRVISVAGNCDGLAAASKADEFFEVEGKKIWLTHGHQARVKLGLGQLVDWAGHYEADLVVYGHTHIADISSCGKLQILNPGSVSRPYHTKPSFLKVRIEKGAFLPELVEMDLV